MPELGERAVVLKMGETSAPTKKRGRRPRSFVKRDDFQNLSAVRMLPPGTIRDYHELCKAENPGVSISRTLFGRVALMALGIVFSMTLRPDKAMQLLLLIFRVAILFFPTSVGPFLAPNPHTSQEKLIFMDSWETVQQPPKDS